MEVERNERSTGKVVPVSLSGEFGSFVGWGPFDQLDSFDVGSGGSTHLRNSWEICGNDRGKLEYLAHDFFAVLSCETDEELMDKVHVFGTKCITAYGKWGDSRIQEDTEARALDKATIMLIHVIFGHNHRELGHLAQGLIDWYTLYQDMLELPQSSISETVDPKESWSAVHLAQWYNRCEAEGEKFSLYWDCCLRCAALGWDVALVELLKLHTSYRSVNPSKQQETEVEFLQLVMALVESRPRLGSILPYDVETNMPRDCANWEEFQSMLQGFNGHISVIRRDYKFEEARQKNPAFANNLERILLVLSAKIQPLKESTHGWLEFLVGQLKSRRADSTREVLPNLALECMNVKGDPYSSEDRRPWLLELLMASVDLDIPRVLDCLMDCDVPLSPMCRVHSAAMLMKHGFTRDAWLAVDPSIGVSRIERYCMEVASGLEDWGVAFKYLEGCPKGKKGAMIARLDALQVGSEDFPLHTALEVCKRAGIVKYGNRLLHEHGVRLIQRGELGESLSCLIQSQDLKLANVILDRMLDDLKIQLDVSLQQEKLALPAMPYEDWLDSVMEAANKCGFDSPILSFFQSYRDLRKNLDEILYGRPESDAASICAKSVRKGFLSILDADHLPHHIGVHFITRACRVHKLYPEVFDVFDCVALAANLDKAASEDATANRILHQFRIDLFKLLQTAHKS
ncbi:hypothetical protein BSKO_08606 [Bryopsis sp. KO-2023]|nr:hypothetical protein BSKO_08606 [Bryopsis sp. KO-2023]